MKIRRLGEAVYDWMVLGDVNGCLEIMREDGIGWQYLERSEEIMFIEAG